MKKWSLKHIAKEIVTTLLMVFIISLLINHFRQPEVSDQLPKLELTTLTGEEASTHNAGKPTVLHFWATWCPTCKFEAPNLEAIQDEVNLITVVVNSGEDQTVRDFIKEQGYGYSVVNDRDGKLAQQFNVEAFPTTFMYDATGALAFVEVGYSTSLGLQARVALIE
ncbi:MAG TPA: redoxin domain-containing protein [Campylobacterales bacterium]|nr:redoxin domain-containing protein [Campylobacterales bacterium]